MSPTTATPTVVASSPVVGSNNKLTEIQIDATKKLAAVRSVIDQSSLVRRAMGAPYFYGISVDIVKGIVDEYCKFLVCKSHAKDTNAKFLSATGAVDAVWNIHLVDTMNYKEACNTVGVSFIHNNPEDCCLPKQVLKKRFDTTHLLYFKLFGCPPPAAAWHVNISADTVLTAEQGAVLGKERMILIDCGHIDCKCETKMHSRIQFVVKESQYANLFWQDHAKEDKTRATKASNEVLCSITSQLGEPLTPVLMDRLGMSKRRKEFFLRDTIPNYIDAVVDCPNHCVGMEGSEAIAIFIKNAADEASFELHVLSSFSVLHVKVLIRAVLTNGHIPVANQTLLFSGKQLEDYLTLADYGITTSNQATIQLVTSA